MKIEAIILLMFSVVVLGVVPNNTKIHSRVRRFSGDRIRSRLPYLQFSKEPPPSQLTPNAGSNIVLTCYAGGSPLPTVYWLKNGKRFSGSSNERDDFSVENTRNGMNIMVDISTTKAKLYLDCLLPQDSGEYTCTAKTRYNYQITTKTQITVKYFDGPFPPCVKDRLNNASPNDENMMEVVNAYLQVLKPNITPLKNLNGIPARIVMNTETRIELEEANIQLFCRALGSPFPHHEWYDRNNNIIYDGDKYEILSNGDLLIKRLNFDQDMGSYTCKVSNIFGSDEEKMFVYPTTWE